MTDNNTLLQSCTCGCNRSTSGVVNDIDVFKCARCGVVRHALYMTELQLQDWYKTEYHQSQVYKHTYAQDLKAAKSRLKAYNIDKGSRILDVGCGNNAFVNAARSKGIDAWGQELSTTAEHEYVYSGVPLLDIHFPTDHFNVVTLHDVLEHVPDPIVYLQECFRVVSGGGRVIVEIPDGWSDDGVRHWKVTEHLWYWTAAQIQDLVEQVGFVCSSVGHPVSGKIKIEAVKPIQHPVSILVPPGIGDIYWSITKIQALAKQHHWQLPVDVYIASTDPTKDRSLDYVKRVPFVRAMGYKHYDYKNDPIFIEAYHDDGRTVFEDVCGCDYFIAYNGKMRWGHSLDAIEPLDTSWYHDMFVSLPETRYGASLRSKIGPYIVGYFVPHGMYKHWLEQFNVEKIYELLSRAARMYQCKIVLIGAKWDKQSTDHTLMQMDEGNGYLHNITGDTTLEQAFGVLRYAKSVIGFPSGITIMSTVFRTPTLMLWNRYFDERFWWHACPPHSRMLWYDAIDTTSSVDAALFAHQGLVDHNNGTAYVKSSDSGGNSKRRSKVKVDTAVRKSFKPKVKKQVHVVPLIKAKHATAICCVMRSGGDFNGKYIQALKSGLQDHCKGEYDFYCLTDDHDGAKLNGNGISLKHSWPGWWSKLELFREDLFTHSGHERILYLDLDTVIVGDISGLLKQDMQHGFYMLEGMGARKHRRGSGIMLWNRDYSDIYKKFAIKSTRILAGRGRERPFGDQQFIENELLRSYGVVPGLIQDFYCGVCSYKNDVKPIGAIPSHASIVCFHGSPRPHEVKEPCIRDNWL